MNYLKTSEKGETNDYPYGYLKATAFFSVEFKKGKGFRSVFQTINPKTNQLNKPKLGTYNPIMVVTEENGFYDWKKFHYDSPETFNKMALFMHENFDLFTKEQIIEIGCHMVTYVRLEAHSICVYCGAKPADVIPILEQPLKMALGVFKTGTNMFSYMLMDIEKLNACKVPDFQPFKIKEY